MRNSIYIVGGGSSLVGFDFSKLTEKDTIAVNQSIYDIKDATYFITVDKKYLTECRFNALEFPNTDKYFVYGNQSIKDSLTDEEEFLLKHFDTKIVSYSHRGFGFSLDKFCNGGNSGYCALQLAVILGYTEINLLGFDLSCVRSTHYHNKYNARQTGYCRRSLTIFEKFFRDGLPILLDSGLSIYSYSKDCPLNDLLEYKELDTIGYS